MKCRVCGYEVEAGASHCPMCGTRVISAADRSVSEISWNTKDFPKPREMADIEMSWPEMNRFTHAVPVSEEKIEEALDKKEPLTVVSDDASEGYVSRPTPAEEKPERRLYIPPMSNATMEVRTSNVPPEAKPKDEPALPAYWYTQKFTATGIMQTGPAWPMAPGSTNPAYPTTATIETMTLSDPVPIMPSGKEEGPGFTLDDILREAKEPERKPSEPAALHSFVNPKAAESAPAMSADTLRQKNEEFQRLLDREYDKLRVLHGDDEDENFIKNGLFVPEEKVQAKDLLTFEKMLMQSEAALAEKTPAQRFFTEPTEEENAGGGELAAFIAPADDPSSLDINKIEDTIRELEEQESIAESLRNERKKRLETMAAARDAYYASLDKALGKKEEAAPRIEDAFEPEEPVEDASPIDLGDEDEEPTKKIPVGSILKALAAGGTLAALEKSMEAAAEAETAAESVVETAAETVVETVSEPAVKTAAMAATSLASISEDIGWTRVFKRSLTEEAEDRAKIYEEQADEASGEAQSPADAAEEIAKKYEAVFGRPARPEEETAAAEDAAEAEAPAEEQPAAEAEAPAEEQPVAEAEVPAEEQPAAEALTEEQPVAEALTEEQPAEATENALPEAADQTAADIDAKLAEAEKAMEAKLAEADAAIAAAAQPAAETEEIPAEEQPEVEADVDDALARIAAALTAAADGAETEAEGEPEGETETEGESEAGPENRKDVLEEIIAEGAAPSEPTYEININTIEEGASKPEEDKKDEDEDITEAKSRHVFLKIIAIILIICALFEGVVYGLKYFAPEAQITQNAVQIEQGVVDAFGSLYDSVAEGIQKLFGGN